MPGIDQQLAEQVCRFVELVRQQRLAKVPGVAETLDWAMALVALHRTHLDPEVVEQTMGILFKDWQDMRQMKGALTQLLHQVGVKTILAPEGEAGAGNK
ncbi:MAG: hypothetical protein D6715_14835 [Calditrichaeota bacterium]|nr:MAG: hypothetical protein D6715_14835 [Calditrichota bacterium]